MSKIIYFKQRYDGMFVVGEMPFTNWARATRVAKLMGHLFIRFD
jgi:hypothetical protein